MENDPLAPIATPYNYLAPQGHYRNAVAATLSQITHNRYQLAHMKNEK